jgi:hypothetical protein
MNRVQLLLCIVLACTTFARANTISGFIFQDTNGDGKFEASEKPLAGVTVTLDHVAKTTSDITGRYTITVAAGNYIVSEIVPAGQKLTTPASISVTVTATNVLGLKNFGNAPLPTTQPLVAAAEYYVSNTGNDANDGSALHPWKTVQVKDNATVFLTAGETFAVPATGVDFSGHQNATVSSTLATTPAVLTGALLSHWNTQSTQCTLANVTLDSATGTGYAGDVMGTGIHIANVNFNNLGEGLHYDNCQNLTITGGGQIGKVAGRCHYLISVTGINWTGDKTKVFGPASTQSPIRFSSPGVVGGTITNVQVTQVGSPFPIACWAIHAAVNVQFIDCSANGGEFSFNSAGNGTGDKVTGCTITNLTTVNTKVSVDAIATGNHFIGGSFTNPTGECVSLSCPPTGGNTFAGVMLHSPIHGSHFYTANDTKISTCTLHANSKATPMMDGASTSANDGGGNQVIVP